MLSATCFFCAMVAYGMSKGISEGKKLYTVMGVLTMFFSGGIIPTYLLIKSLGMLNSFWVYIIPALFSYYDAIILMNFSGRCRNPWRKRRELTAPAYGGYLSTSYCPHQSPLLATIALFHGVSQWNDFMTAKLYITEKALYPLQMKLYEIIVQQQMATMTNPTSVTGDNNGKRDTACNNYCDDPADYNHIPVASKAFCNRHDAGSG